MSIPGLDWGMDEVMGKDAKKVPQKKVPYAKPIPAQFQQVTVYTCLLLLAPGGQTSNVHGSSAGLGREQSTHDAPLWRSVQGPQGGAEGGREEEESG